MSYQDFDEEYLPQSLIRQKGRKKNSQLNKNYIRNASKWTLEQNIKFSNFIKLYKQILMCPIKRKQERVFLRMSQEIKSRSPDQCRSHHQKMIKYHKTLEGIIENIDKRSKGNCDEPSLYQNSVIQEPSFKKKSEIELVDHSDTNIGFEVQNEPIKDEKIWEVLNIEVWTQSPLISRNEKIYYQ